MKESDLGNSLDPTIHCTFSVQAVMISKSCPPPPPSLLGFDSPKIESQGAPCIVHISVRAGAGVLGEVAIGRTDGHSQGLAAA
jgi:hypothetical protein